MSIMLSWTSPLPIFVVIKYMYTVGKKKKKRKKPQRNKKVFRIGGNLELTCDSVHEF